MVRILLWSLFVGIACAALAAKGFRDIWEIALGFMIGAGIGAAFGLATSGQARRSFHLLLSAWMTALGLCGLALTLRGPFTVNGLFVGLVAGLGIGIIHWLVVRGGRSQRERQTGTR